VTLKIGNKAPPFEEAFSIIPSGPIDTLTLREAVYRFADSVIAGNDRYRAVTSILKRADPRIQGYEPGAAIITPGDEPVPAATDAISRLEHSHLLIQGPPGAGKTFLSAYAIVDLLARGWRVAVASNSHKAINNLLAEIERQALERQVSFRGVKKCSDEDDRCNGTMIADVMKNDDVAAFPYNLVAGTAWLFARPNFDQAFDYLFIDEAGQVSLANVVAMGVCARNVVLVGDQMQLAQPIQGDHPGESGLSALEYVLGDRATVPPERGVFLGVTRRMHPDVCRFISQAVYEGRLLAEASTATQVLVLGSGADGALRASGISFAPVTHEECGQKSEEEGVRVREIYRSLLQQDWIDREPTILPTTAAIPKASPRIRSSPRAGVALAATFDMACPDAPCIRDCRCQHTLARSSAECFFAALFGTAALRPATTARSGTVCYFSSRLPRSAPVSPSNRFRAICIIHASLGCVVMPHRLTRRVARSITKPGHGVLNDSS
jgi:hypothetical protein